MGKYQVLNELKEIGISFPERSKEDALIESINRLGYNVTLDQTTDFRWMVSIFKWVNNRIVDSATSFVRDTRLDALKEAAWLAIDR